MSEECIRPIVHSDSCETAHIGLALSGTLHVKHNDGTEREIAAGSDHHIAPGRDAWNTRQ